MYFTIRFSFHALYKAINVLQPTIKFIAFSIDFLVQICYNRIGKLYYIFKCKGSVIYYEKR